VPPTEVNNDTPRVVSNRRTRVRVNKQTNKQTGQVMIAFGIRITG
jgi:hypothetical protein